VVLLRYLCGMNSTYGTLFCDVLALHDRMRFVWKADREQLQFTPHAVVRDIMKQRDGSIRQLREELEYTRLGPIGNDMHLVALTKFMTRRA
jgi:hypothetical protein